MAKDVFLCSSCGRDTENKSGICGRCNRHSHEEEIGRMGRSSVIFSGSPIEDLDDDEMLSSLANYHGSSCRDDL